MRSLAPVGWWLLTARLGPGDDAEALAGRLWSLGANGTAEASEAGVTSLTAGFADGAAAHRAAAALDRPDVTTAPVDEHGWVETWRRSARPTEVGGLLVRAPWHPPRPGAGVEVVIDPGPTFGHGGHPTTGLVLGELARLVGPATTVLDVGCGSGVLAVAAAALGAARVVAVDTDAGAVAAARANADRNALDVDVRAGTVGPDLGRFDLVLANLLAPVLRHLGPDLVAATGPTGRLLVAGLLDRQRRGVEAALGPLTTLLTRHDGDWSLLELGRDTRASAPGGRPARPAATHRSGDTAHRPHTVEER